jgi:hypothetical protein
MRDRVRNSWKHLSRPRHVAPPASLLLCALGCVTACAGIHLPCEVPASAGPSAVQACAADPGELDLDHDGLSDACEDRVAARFAPIVHHAEDEQNLPVDVDTLLAESSLYFYDDACAPDLKVRVARAPTQKDLVAHTYEGGCGAADVVRSAGTRSANKGRTFFLDDVSLAARAGSRDPKAWMTYVHVYASANGGVTAQYWRLYAYNDGNSQHGGDWEGMHVVTDAALRPAFVRLLGHASIEEVPWGELEVEDEHVRVWSEPGGHSTRAHGPYGSVVRHETWNGRATWPGGESRRAGALVNVGEKNAPLHDQLFVAYSGIWGSPGTFYVTSGYWGPAFNETSMRGDFVTAWCSGMSGPRAAGECAPQSVTR